jgi:hypothetical protein
MPTNPGLEAMGYLRAAKLLLAEAYQHAANDVGENFIRNDRAPRNNEHLVVVAQAWNDAEVEFRRACTTLAPTIDASLRLADIESIGQRLATFPTHTDDSPVSVPEVAAFDKHIHELFEEIQRQWPELEQPPLETFDDDDMALRSPLRLAFERQPLRVIFVFAVLIYVVGWIGWAVLTSL